MKKRIEELLSNELAKDILMFFHENQSSIDSIGGVSAWVHKSRKEVEVVLEELVKLGVLEKDSTTATNGYCYTRDIKIIKLLEKLLKNV